METKYDKALKTMQEESYKKMDKIRVEVEKQELDPREKDLRELCSKVLLVTPNVHYNSCSYDTSTCPFCEEYVKYPQAEMNEIKHLDSCATLIAKDLLTNL